MDLVYKVTPASLRKNGSRVAKVAEKLVAVISLIDLRTTAMLKPLGAGFGAAGTSATSATSASTASDMKSLVCLATPNDGAAVKAETLPQRTERAITA